MKKALFRIAATPVIFALYLWTQIMTVFWRVVLEDRERQPATKTESFTGGQ